MNPFLKFTRRSRSIFGNWKSAIGNLLCLLLALAIWIPRASQGQTITAYFALTNAIPGATNSATIGAVTLTWTNAPLAAADVQISTNLATAAQNLETAFATNTSLTLGASAYFPGNTTFTLSGVPGGALTASVLGPWGYVVLGTNSSVGYAASLVITNSGAAIVSSYTPFKCVAPTNNLILPSYASLLAKWKPGDRFGVQKVDAITNLLAVQAGTAMGILRSAATGRDSGTNNFVLNTPDAYGSGHLDEEFTNGLSHWYIWLGDTNYVSQ